MGDSSSSPLSASASYIHMVHRLIEECILFNMSREECMDALSKHASIRHLITSTVWKELEKENQGFFEAYAKQISERGRQTGRGQGGRCSPIPPNFNSDSE